jgi:hypothetical protein
MDPEKQSSLNTRVNELIQYLEKIKNVDKFTCKTGAVATVFVHIDNDFLRISTTVPNYDGKPATNTVLDHANPAYARLLNGKSFTGYEELFGSVYFAKYVPDFVDNKIGTVTALFVGIPVEPACFLKKDQEKVEYLSKYESKKEPKVEKKVSNEKYADYYYKYPEEECCKKENENYKQHCKKQEKKKKEYSYTLDLDEKY